MVTVTRDKNIRRAGSNGKCEMNRKLCACFSDTDPDTNPASSLHYVAVYRNRVTKTATLRMYLVDDNLAE